MSLMMAIAPAPDLRKAHERCGACPIRHRAVCSCCGPAELAELDRAKFYREYAPGQEIVGEGEVTRTLGSVVTGVVALHKSMEDGRRQIVGLLFASDFIGRPLRPVAPCEAVAVTEVRMCLFRRSQFEEILSSNQSLGRRLLEMTLDELDAAREWMLLLGRKSAREKVASFLMILARRAALLEKRSIRDTALFQIPLSREAIAEYLGLTIETVSRQLTALRKDGIIELQGARSVSVRNFAALAVLAGEEAVEGDGRRSRA
jgi:CRP/FNR family transcriptional regulator, anaerobic regulatory protein